MTVIGHKNLKDARRLVVLDTETTGFSALDGDRIVEIGCVEMINGQQTGNVFHEYLDPERPMPEAAQRVHGLSDEFLKGKPKFAEKADAFLEFIADSPLVIHNAEFDVGFLNAELKATGRPALANEVCDTLDYARRTFPGARATLDALCTRFKVDRSSRTVHGALLDASLLAQLYARMMGIDGLGISGPVVGGVMASRGEQTRSHESGPAVRKVRPRRDAYRPSDAERLVHEALLAQIKEPLWSLFEAADEPVATLVAA